MTTKTWSSTWFYGAAAVCLLLIVTTFFDIDPFNLRNERNYATLWSGMLLFLIGLHAFDGVVLYNKDNPPICRAWLVISIILITLSFDEIGSWHDRLPADSHLMYWSWVFPFALTYALLAVYALITFYRDEQFRHTAILIAVAFLLFGSVAVQEELEWRLGEWGLKVGIFAVIRAIIEEGTELFAMLLLLKACMPNTQGVLAQQGDRKFPTFEALRIWRGPATFIGLLGAPLIGAISISLKPSEHGIPADWPAAAFFMLAGLAAVRPLLSGERTVEWIRWLIVALCLLGCAATTKDIGSVNLRMFITIISLLASLAWIVDRKLAVRDYLPAVIFLTLILGVQWAAPTSAWWSHTYIQYVALAFYFVCSAPERNRVDRGAEVSGLPT